MRRTRSEWVTIVEEFERADEMHEQFCARRGLNVGSFRAWLYRLRRSAPKRKVAQSATATVRLLPVHVRGASASIEPISIDVLVRGIVVRVHVGANPQYVSELAAALAARC